MGWLFLGLTWIAGVIALVGACLAMLAGLLVACDFAEEYPSYAKKYLRTLSTVVILSYVLLYCTEKREENLMPWLPTLLSIVTNVCYRIFFLGSSFPILSSPFSPSVLLCITMTIVVHFLWSHHFVSRQKLEYIKMSQHSYSYHSHHHQQQQYKQFVSLWSMIGFFTVLVWLVPLGLFVSMTLAEDCLPTNTTQSHKNPRTTKKEHRNSNSHVSSMYNASSSSSSSSSYLDTHHLSLHRRRDMTLHDTVDQESYSSDMPFQSHDSTTSIYRSDIGSFSQSEKGTTTAGGGMILKQLMERWKMIPRSRKNPQDSKKR